METRFEARTAAIMEYMSIINLKLELSTFEGGWSCLSAAYAPDLNQVNARCLGFKRDDTLTRRLAACC